MKPLNLREFAEQMLLGDHREFAIEILDNLDFVENSEAFEIEADLAHHVNNCGGDISLPPLKAIEWLGYQAFLLGEVKEALANNGFSGDPFRDPHDEVTELIGTLSDAETLLQNAKVWEGDLLESIALLLERVPAYDL